MSMDTGVEWHKSARKFDMGRVRARIQYCRAEITMIIVIRATLHSVKNASLARRYATRGAACTGSTKYTSMFSVVIRSLPMWPCIFFFFQVLDGVFLW